MTQSSPSTRRWPRWSVLGLGLVVAWIVWLSILILSEPPAGAASAEELREQVAVAFNAGDAEALAGVLAAPLTGDGDLATEYVTRLRDAGAQRVTIVNGQLNLPAGGQEFSPLVARYFSPTAAR